MSLGIKHLLTVLALLILTCPQSWADDAGEYRGLAQAGQKAMYAGKFSEAETKFLKASKKARIAGPLYKFYAQSLIDLGELYDRKKQVEKSASKYKEALAIYKKAYGKDTTQAAECYHGLGELYRHNKKYTESIPYYTKAIKIRRKTAPNHPKLAKSEHGLARTYLSLKQYTEAQRYLKDVLAIQEKVYGNNSKKVVRTLFELANAYEGAKSLDLAIPTYKKVIKILSTTYGPKSQKVATTYEKLGSIYRRKRKYKSAETCCSRALAIREKGKDKKKLRKCLFDYIYVLQKLNKDADAKKMKERLAALK